MDRRFLLAYTDPSRLRMLGKTLYPWCLKYRVWLTAIESPLAVGGTCGPEDLLMAVNVCSESPVGAFSMLERWRLLRLASNPDEFKRLLKLFEAYTMVSHWPKFWQKKTEGPAKTKGMPWPMVIVSNLIANGIPEKRAWEMPECQAIWLNTALVMRKGADLNILTSEEEKELDELDKIAAAAEASKKVANSA